MYSKPLRYIAFGLSITGLVFSASLHVLTYWGYLPPPIAKALHVLLFTLFLIVIIDFLRVSPDQTKKGLLQVPRSWYVILAVAAVYATGTLVRFFLRAEFGTPVEEAGRYALQNHGKFIKVLEREEFLTLNLMLERAISAHWIGFFLLLAVFFLRIDPHLRSHELQDPGPEKVD